MEELVCKRCHHTWVRRQEKLPSICPKCKSSNWDKEKQKKPRIHLTEDDIIELNKISLENIKAKKADKHETLNYRKLREIMEESKNIQGDVYDEAVYLLRSILQNHPFASGNRRTALVAATMLLHKNNEKNNIRNYEKQNRVLQGIRENYYSNEEIRKWLMEGEIHEFER